MFLNALKRISLFVVVVLLVSSAMVVSACALTGASSNNPIRTDLKTEESHNLESYSEIQQLSLTPFAQHGALSVNGSDLVDATGQKFQLHGLSTHGLAWFPQYVNYDAFKTLRDDWNANVVRLAMYTAEYGGYCTGGNQSELTSLVRRGVDAATDLGMYVIVDWHVMNEDANPLKYMNEAKVFFNEMSSLYRDRDNVIYEICNEPCGGTSWNDIKQYAEEIIPIIRANDSNAVVLVGTPEWSQRIDEAAADRLAFNNVMYSLHFYASTHTQWLRDRVVSVYNAGLPIFISEFDICDASGNGNINFDEGEWWFELIDRFNLSYCKWSLANKNESSSAILSSCTKTSGWSADELSVTGKWVRDRMRAENGTGASTPITPAPPSDVVADPGNGVFYDTVGHWVENDDIIKKVVKYGLMHGYEDGNNNLTGYFGPNDLITRAQVATILYRMASSPVYSAKNQTPFIDVGDDQYYTPAINWAYDKKILNGYSDNGIQSAKPDKNISRSEFAKMIYTAAEHFGCNMQVERPWDIWQASDAWKIEEWARSSFEWCYAYRIMTGNSQTGELNPQSNATRAEGAKMFTVLHSLL